MLNIERCHLCKGKIVSTIVQHVPDNAGQWFIIENVPALVCQQCDEIYFTPTTHDMILNFVRGTTKPNRFVSIPVYDAAS